MTGVKTILTGEYYPGDEMMHEGLQSNIYRYTSRK
jgi:hypothetical protein